MTNIGCRGKNACGVSAGDWFQGVICWLVTSFDSRKCISELCSLDSGSQRWVQGPQGVIERVPASRGSLLVDTFDNHCSEKTHYIHFSPSWLGKRQTWYRNDELHSSRLWTCAVRSTISVQSLWRHWINTIFTETKYIRNNKNSTCVMWK